MNHQKKNLLHNPLTSLSLILLISVILALVIFQKNKEFEQKLSEQQADYSAQIEKLSQALTSDMSILQNLISNVDKENKKLLLYEIKDMNELAKGYMGILEPSVSEEILTGLDDIGLVIIPGAAFDIHGNRLGYGAGFYDRLLAGMKNKIPVIAPAYEEQIVKGIPSEPHDVKVDKIVTNKRVIECRTQI
jgi:5-formyltetrahydrofolate cyclo-ligase